LQACSAQEQDNHQSQLQAMWSNPDSLLKVQNNGIKMGDHKMQNIKTVAHKSLKHYGSTLFCLGQKLTESAEFCGTLILTFLTWIMNFSLNSSSSRECN